MACRLQGRGPPPRIDPLFVPSAADADGRSAAGTGCGRLANDGPRAPCQGNQALSVFAPGPFGQHATLRRYIQAGSRRYAPSIAPFSLHRFWFLLALIALTGQLLVGMQARSAHLQGSAGTFLCSLETAGTGSTVGQALADFLEDQDRPSGPDAGHCDACPAVFAAGLPGPAFPIMRQIKVQTIPVT